MVIDKKISINEKVWWQTFLKKQFCIQYAILFSKGVSMSDKAISIQTLQRLPKYLNYLRTLPVAPSSNVSSSTIASALGLNNVQVRKDLACVSEGGRPKIGYLTSALIEDIESFLGYNNTNSAVIVGAGNLGRALLSYKGFASFGLDIVMAFDSNKDLIGTDVSGKQILPANKLQNLCRRMQIKLGIITVPAAQAQNICDQLVAGGVMAIWNFAPIHLHVPENVLLQNENMACSLALLSKHLQENMHKAQSI